MLEDRIADLPQTSAETTHTTRPHTLTPPPLSSTTTVPHQPPPPINTDNTSRSSPTDSTTTAPRHHRPRLKCSTKSETTTNRKAPSAARRGSACTRIVGAFSSPPRPFLSWPPRSAHRRPSLLLRRRVLPPRSRRLPVTAG
ncbi:hypothetical protein PIB30_006919 [Stylosanthes scabra]|uniref:Uncharacterized protein n=1 Tax=Stylosanthes scabra TaxID=79078 RepID=A0ABU6X1U0_9FABA|nr:hypothetical protein [Stylosanthes scabra]